MSDSGSSAVAVEPPLKGEGERLMSDHDHHPDAGLDLEPVPGPEHLGDEVEREQEPAPKKKGPRLPFARRSVGGAGRWKRETRFGVAALLSFVILVTVLLINK